MARNDRERDERLPEELRELGRGLGGPPVDGETVVERVLADIVAARSREGDASASSPAPHHRGFPGRAGRLRALWARVRRRKRALAAGLCGLVVLLALTPPVRAAVVEWFDFGGVEVRYDPSARPPGSPQPPECGELSAQAAARKAGLDAVAPRGVDAFEGAAVSADGQVLSLCWRGEDGRRIRLDQFPAALDPAFAKLTPVPHEWLSVKGAIALWFPEPHRLELKLTSLEGRERSVTVRPAGPTLVWEHSASLTLRLEGVPSTTDAIQLAESVRRLGT